MPTIPRPLRFYNAVAIKKFAMNDGIVTENQPMFVAKWKNLFVLAKNNQSYFVTTAEKAAEYTRTFRDSTNKKVVATNGPRIIPVGGRFEWHVEAGTTDEDNCDENSSFTRLVQDEVEARALVDSLKTTRFTNHVRNFLRIRGPAFYSYERPPARPVAAPRPARRTAVMIPSMQDDMAFYARLVGMEQQGGLPRQTISQRTPIASADVVMNEHIIEDFAINTMGEQVAVIARPAASANPTARATINNQTLQNALDNLENTRRTISRAVYDSVPYPTTYLTRLSNRGSNGRSGT
jgi:hypothetical protein